MKAAAGWCVLKLQPYAARPAPAHLTRRRPARSHPQGLEPALALVGLAGKRLSPGDPDKTVARPPPIPWWDDLR